MNLILALCSILFLSNSYCQSDTKIFFMEGPQRGRQLYHPSDLSKEHRVCYKGEIVRARYTAKLLLQNDKEKSNPDCRFCKPKNTVYCNYIDRNCLHLGRPKQDCQVKFQIPDCRKAKFKKWKKTRRY